jgi:hypothetical protein
MISDVISCNFVFVNDAGVGLLAELLNGSDMIAAQVTEDEAKRMLLGVKYVHFVIVYICVY